METLELHCIGGFVFAYFYGLPRTTGDIDYYTAIPANLNLDYVSRLTDMVSGEFKFLKLLIPDPYDCILPKLERNAAKDRDDADFLFRSQKLNAEILRDRYKNELRHNLIGNIDWHGRTLELWIEIFGSQPR